jgi:hypothetical protein
VTLEHAELERIPLAWALPFRAPERSRLGLLMGRFRCELTFRQGPIPRAHGRLIAGRQTLFLTISIVIVNNIRKASTAGKSE